MNINKFDWDKTRPLSVPQIMLAVFGPSAFAFAGFHGVLPRLVTDGMPILIAWPLVAGAMLAMLVVLALVLLMLDARSCGVTFSSRLCLRRVNGRQWLLYTGLAMAMLLVTALLMPGLPVIWGGIGIHPPEYYPFFLRGIDPASTPLELLSPGLQLQGAYWMLPFMGVVLILNILAEDLYFRAWMLPKMAWLGRGAWIANGVLFALYHTFQLWLLPVLLLASLSFAYVVWHSRSVVPSLVLHFVLNFLFTIVGMVALIMGIAK